MEFTDNPLEPHISDRNLAYMRPITSNRGDTVEVHDSSNAESDELWLEFEPTVQPTLDGKYAIALDITDALTFAQQIITLAERRGHERPDLAAARIDAIAEFLERQAGNRHSSDALTEDVHLAVAMGVPLERIYDPEDVEHARAALAADDTAPDVMADTAARMSKAPDPGEEREAGILEIGAYLATMYAAGAMARDLPKRVEGLALSAANPGLADQFAYAQQAAQDRIAYLAVNNETTDQEFPPGGYSVQAIGRNLTRLHADAIALAARCTAVLCEIEPYLDPEGN